MATKYCNTCENNKDVSEFGKNSSKKDGLQSNCTSCRSGMTKDWYKKNTRKQVERVAKTKQDIAEMLYAYKSENPYCQGPCGNQYPPEVLQFDHIDPSTKKFNLGDAARTQGRLKVIEEMEKCVLLCANCHALRTAKQFNWYVNDKNRIVAEIDS